MKTYKLGETGACKVGEAIQFEPGAFINSGDTIWCVVKSFCCLQGTQGLTHEDGTPLNKLRYCVRVTEEAMNEKVSFMKTLEG